MGFTCNYCGLTVKGNEYAEHIETHRAEDAAPRGEAPTDERTDRAYRERAYWRGEYAAHCSEVLGR